ncbi:MAG TPA: F0F1 ATP synthase subunit C [Alphaproteobacteria bacterium]|nr:F0F1 ATP synthase subunit C [Alphaproteobacteria bacterium]
MDIASAKLIGAGLAAVALAGVGIGLGMIFSAWINAIGRNPGAAGAVGRMGWIGFALTEAVAIYALMVVFLVLLNVL